MQKKLSVNTEQAKKHTQTISQWVMLAQRQPTIAINTDTKLVCVTKSHLWQANDCINSFWKKK